MRLLDTLKAWAIPIGLIALLILVTLVMSFCSARDKAERKAAAARAGKVVAEGQANAARDAIGTIEDNQTRSEEVRDRVERGEDAIRNADPDNRDAVALRELCKSPSLSGQSACRELRDAHP